MISVSDKFVSIMNSNIRPKTDFKITVTGSGNTLEWTSKDVTNFEFKRGIDPVGRNLPFLELTWEEIYLGELNTDNEATKYNNITPYMTVELIIEQSLNFVNTWKDISQLTWAEIFNSGMTWRDVLKKPVSESVKMPTMFLVGKPEVQNQKIKWTARDFLYFLNAPQEIGFQSGIPYSNPLRYFLLDERANFKNNPNMIEMISNTQADLKEHSFLSDVLDVQTLYNDTTKNILKNALSVLGVFINFENSGAYFRQMFSYVMYPRPFVFRGNIMKSFPKMTKGKNISSFSFSQSILKEDAENKYTLSEADETIDVSNTNKAYRYSYKDFGKIEIPENSDDFIPKTINKKIVTLANPITIIPVTINNTEIFINNDKNGEKYSESNPCNFWGLNHSYTELRADRLDRWFRDDKYTIEFEGLPVFHLEPFDCVKVETNLFENGVRIVKNGVILEQHLTFNGGFTQKTIVREV